MILWNWRAVDTSKQNFSLKIWQSLGQDEFSTLTKLSALVNDIDPTIDMPKIVNPLFEDQRMLWSIKKFMLSTKTFP